MPTTTSPDALATEPRTSLARRTLLRAAIRIACVVLVASLIGYLHVREGMETQSLDNLQRYVEERRARESQVLDAAEASLGSLDAAFQNARRQLPDASDRFAELFVLRPDETRRTPRALFDQAGISGFVGKYARLTPAERRTLVAAVDVLDRLGPALRDRFRNAYLVTADNAVVMYWPGEPWALDGADWEIFAKLALAPRGQNGDVLVTGAPEDGALVQGPQWSPLYFDYGINEWVVSVTLPVSVDGQDSAALGHDLLVQDLIDRVVRSDIDGAYNVLIDGDGNLIAHPAYMPAIQAHSGAIAIDETHDDLLVELRRIADTARDKTRVFELARHDVFVACTRLAGPDWYLMTVFPKALIASQASEVAWLIIGLGLAALAVELLLLFNVLRGGVGIPLRALADAADRIGQDPSAPLDAVETDLQRRDELGRLARAFHRMVEQLRARHDELSGLNQALAHELNQRQEAERELERHRELNALLNTINYGVLFVDQDLNSRLVNAAYKRLWHTPPGFFETSRTLREDMEESRRQGLYAVSDDDWPNYLEHRLSTVRNGDVGPEEIHFNDGRTLTYQCTALPDGGRMLTYFDITEIKRTEATLRAHLEGMEASMDGMALLDNKGRYVYVNQAHAEVYGFQRDAMIGQSWRELYDEEALRDFETSIMRTLETTGRWRGETVGRRRSGRRFPQELSLAVTETGGLVCVVRDITDRRNRERALALAVRQAEESNAAKSRFLASMSHELRTPLNAIIGFTRIVARKTEGQIDAQQHDNLLKIQSSGEQLLRLINDVLDISKIEAGRTEVMNAPYAPALLAVECARIIEPMLAPGVRLVTETAGVTEGCIGDAAKVRQILTNLLSNAARHTMSGMIRLIVSIDEQVLRFVVEDTGRGIPADALDLIFEEFGQARGADPAPPGGTGLGLTISRRLARLMGGDISVASTPGEGSSFTLELPWQPVRDQANRPLRKAEPVQNAAGDD